VGGGFLKAQPTVGGNLPCQRDTFSEIALPCGGGWNGLNSPTASGSVIGEIFRNSGCEVK